MAAARKNGGGDLSGRAYGERSWEYGSTGRDMRVRVLREVEAAIRRGRPVVALESSVLAQGLPIPSNREAAERMTAAVMRAGALPAITAVASGQATLGLEPDELERFLAREGVRKVSSRDMPVAM